MNGTSSVAAFSAIIFLGALLGGSVAILGTREKRLALFLAFAAGVMLGAAFFHMLPEAFHGGGYRTFTWVPAGFVLLFLLERYVMVHICEEPPECEEHSHGSFSGLTAFFGLSVHTLFDGIALGSAASQGVGLMAFIAIFAHKVPSSVALASILRHDGKSIRSVLLYTAAFGLMVPIGALLYFGLDAALEFSNFASRALSFSAGTFLYIAVSDLLPRVSRHGKDKRLKSIVGFLAGLLLMFGLTFVTHHPPG